MKRLTRIVLVLLPFLFALGAFGQCPPSGGGGFDGDLTITGSCSVSSDLLLNKKNLTISSTGSLTITGDFDNDGSGSIILDGGTLTITGAFNNNGNGTVIVQNGGTLDVGTDYYNSGNGTTNFTSGSISIGGNYVNAGNGNIDAGGIVSIGGDFTINGNGTNSVSGGLSIGGTATLGSKGVDVADGGVVQAGSIVSVGDIDIEQGGTIYVISGSITGTINNDAGNTDQDCTNNCCGALCNSIGDELSGSGQTVLPIELLYFTADATTEGIQIQWASASEINNDFYTLERSFDGEQYEIIATIDGAGNSIGKLVYNYQDSPNYQGFIFYRLTQTDFDGGFEQFQAIRFFHHQLVESGIKVYPSQVKSGDMVTLTSMGEEIRSVNLMLVMLNGNRYPQEGKRVGDRIQFITSEVPSGLYILQGYINGIAVNERLLVHN
ncbi:MAG: hypothetical protein ABJF04_13115 [Reichenbachiella sp.]|uniref:hypothetical protein n=1 Tax=Reichenbachiella sp. TaxID=2184521 RepID=UPI003265D83F